MRDRVGARGVDGHARGEAHDVLEVLDALLIDHVLAECRDADGHPVDVFLAPGGRNDDFLERTSGGGFGGGRGGCD